MANTKRKILMIIALVVMVLSAKANGDPVAYVSSINRVANPEPLSISEIYFEHETIKITHEDGYNCFDITYHLYNRSDKDFPDIDYGFPIDYSVEDEQETYRFLSNDISERLDEVGWNDVLIKDIAFTFNGEILPFHSSKESVREAGYDVNAYEDYCDSTFVCGINRRWFYTRFSMNHCSDAILNVRYKVYANSFLGLYSDRYEFSYYARNVADNHSMLNLPFTYRYFISDFKILYDFTPAKHFGGNRLCSIDVDIDLSNLKNPCTTFNNGYSYYANLIKRRIFARPKEIEPLCMSVNFQSDRSAENIKRIIADLMIPESEYDVTIEKNNVRINFQNPTFVTDLACDLDTNAVKAISSVITYADGNQKSYQYNTNTEIYILNKEERVSVPILLTITDLYTDWLYGYENRDQAAENDKYKIKNINLIFETDNNESLVCRNVKTLDARFVKNSN